MAKHLQMCGSESEMREVAARICRDYLHGAWKTVKPSALEFKRISGGLSNFLYYVALPGSARGRFLQRDSSPEGKQDKSPVARLRARTWSRSNSFNIEEPKKVLLRIYGQVHGERALDAIVTESVIFTLLSERRLGPRLHGVFSGGRIEEYIPGRSLQCKELSEPALSMKIAEKMSAIHAMDVPLKKEPHWLWKTMARWLRTIEDQLPAVQPKDDNEAEMVKRIKRIEFGREIEWLQRFLAGIESPVVFCHNDMQEGNILLLDEAVSPSSDDEVHSSFVMDESSTDIPGHDDSSTLLSSREPQHSPKSKSTLECLRLQYAGDVTTDSVSSHISDSGEPKLVLIDFEYCAYNHRGFDIANHLQEWGYDYANPDYPFYHECHDRLPTLQQKEIFIREYLKHMLSGSEEAGSDPTPTIDEVNALLAEVDAFALASHLFWALWSVVSAMNSQIPFGYWDYGVSRAEYYLRLKHEVMKKDKVGAGKRKICEVDI